MKIFLFSLLLSTSFSFSQVVEKDVVKSGDVQNNITSTETVMYEGTKSKKAKEYYDEALDYSRSQDYNNAEKLYLKAIKEDPDFVEAYDNLGRVYRRIGNLEKAEEYYKKSIALYPNGVMAHQNLAVVYSIKKDYKKAIDEYKEILRVSPGNVEGYFGLANSYMASSELDKALENSKKALEIYKSTNSHHIGDGYYLTGLIYYYKNDKEEAKKHIVLAKENGSKIHPKLQEELFGAEEKSNSNEQIEELLKKYNWLLKTPIGAETEKRKEYNASLIRWMTESPDVTIELSQTISPYMTDCIDCMVIFMGGWSEYTLSTKKYSKTEAALVGTERVIEFYLRNKQQLGVNNDIEKFIKLKEKNKLKNFIKKNI